ncbi:secreted alpha glucosidase like family 31 glycosyltransferase [Cryptosporidium sp. chipmunk genotype I]|uniref:secreted alpha glucosidase like family 31 glycosyltransferase n=1 Tax=Cryptosporidium sp. chipmunk genotype I TaxID=1280935 RepID=UPI00351A098D|nr:secreted alpha glucosidase like family 31 glycosyltransferase [Cryptosporidium sp. chipmunk genotype I]
MKLVSVSFFLWTLILIIINFDNSNGAKFKKCKENAFCNRYREFTKYISSKTSNEKDATISIWSVNPNNLEFFKNCKLKKKNPNLALRDSEECSTLYFELKNTHHPKVPSLKCNLYIFKLGIFRLQIDDTGTGLSNYKRFKVGKEVMFKDSLVGKYLVNNKDSGVHITISKNRVKIIFARDIVYKKVTEVDDCKYIFEMQFNPFKIESFLCDKKIITINGNQFFNFERSGRIYPKFNKVNTKFNRKIYTNNFKDLFQEIKYNLINFKWSSFKNAFFKSIKNIFYNGKGIIDILDSVDIYPKNIWAEKFENFIDFKYAGPTAVGTDVQIHSCNDTYGLAEKTASLNLEDFDEPYRFYNVDNFKYKLNSTDPIYGSSPMLISLSDFSHEQENQVLFSSILWVNPSDTYVKINKTRNLYSEKYIDTWWVSETGILDLVILLSTQLEELYYNLGIIMGFPYFAPRFSLGFHYSKWEYTNEERVYSIQNLLKKNNIPYDSIWLDIEHTVDKQYFTWNKTAFPNMSKMIKKLEKDNKYLIIISDPHFSVNKAYYIYSFFEKLKYCNKDFSRISLNYKRMLRFLFIINKFPIIISKVNCQIQLIIYKENISNSRFISKPFDSPWIKIPNYYYKSNEVNDFIGECWPGPSKYLNLFSNNVGNYYSKYFEKMYKTHKNLGYWVDMNEPSVFKLPELSLPKQVEFGNNGLDDRQVHSLYSFYQVKYTFNGLIRKFQGERRPFILSRSFWFGSHRYSNIWTGDTESNWDYYYYTIITNVRNAICGFSMTGSDIGGFDGLINTNLLTRWFQLGIWFPFYRIHNSINTLSRVFIFSSKIVKKYIELRYSLIPYWYTLLAKYSFYGIPMIKPLFWLNQRDFNLRSINNSFLVGDSFMIKSIENNSPFTQIKLHYYLCNFDYNNRIYNHNKDDLYKIWYNLYSGKIYIDTKTQYFDNEYMNNTPDFVKGGSIITYSSESNLLSSKDQLKNSLKLVIYLTGKLLDSNKFKNNILFPEIKYYDYLNEEFFYNDYMIDILTLHSEGSIYLDDGETYSYLKNEYIFDDIIFNLFYNGFNKHFGYCPNIIDNIIEKNILISTFDENYQKDKLRLFKENFGYEIYIKEKNDKLMGKMNNNNYHNHSHHHILSLLDEDIGNLFTFKEDNNINQKYHKRISKIEISGIMIIPKEIILEKNNNNSLIFQKLKYKLIKIKYTGNNNLIQGSLYSIEINLEENNQINFGDYDWRIKILL